MSQSSKLYNQVAIATISDYRLPIYPVSKGMSSGVRSGKWGEFKVERGAVTARHRDVLDAIISLALDTNCVKSSTNGEIEMHILYDAKEVLRMLDTKSTYTWLKSMIMDMQGTVISIKQKDEVWPDSWSLVSFHGNSKKTADRRPDQYQAALKKIVLSPGAVKWMAHDIRVFIKKEVVADILALNHQVSRSVARWFLSHSNEQNHKIEDVLLSVGCVGGSHQINKRINQMIDDADGFKKLGITVGKTVRSVKIDGVWFKNPIKHN